MFCANLVAGTIDLYEVSSLTANQNFAIKGQNSVIELSARLTDMFGAPVLNDEVVFSVAPPNNQNIVIKNKFVLTDEQGIAKTFVEIKNTQKEDVNIIAYAHSSSNPAFITIKLKGKFWQYGLFVNIIAGLALFLLGMLCMFCVNQYLTQSTGTKIKQFLTIKKS